MKGPFALANTILINGLPFCIISLYDINNLYWIPFFAISFSTKRIGLYFDTKDKNTWNFVFQIDSNESVTRLSCYTCYISIFDIRNRRQFISHWITNLHKIDELMNKMNRILMALCHVQHIYISIKEMVLLTLCRWFYEIALCSDLLLELSILKFALQSIVFTPSFTAVQKIKYHTVLFWFECLQFACLDLSYDADDL